MKKTVWLAMVLWGVGAMGCRTDVGYSKAEGQHAEDAVAPSVAVPELGEVFPAPIEGPCDSVASLSADNVWVDGNEPHEFPRLEETQDGSGKLLTRTLRWLHPDAALARERLEYFNEEGCLALVTARRWDVRGLLIEEATTVFDDEFGFNLSPYAPIVTHTVRWTHDAMSLEVLHTVDAGSDGVEDMRIETRRDGQGRMVWRSTMVGDGTQDAPQVVGWRQAQTETVQYDAEGNIVREEIQVEGGRREIIERTFEAPDRLVLMVKTNDGDEVDRVEKTWRGDGQPLTERREAQSGHDHTTRWDYDDRGTLVGQETLEDFEGDGRPDRQNNYEFNAAGQVLFEQDQPFDGQRDWREETGYDAQGHKTLNRATNLAEGTIAREIRWTNTASGQPLREETAVEGWGELPRHRVWSYDGEGREVRVAWFEQDTLVRETLSEYGAHGLVRHTEDDDADGRPERVTSQVFDRAGNLLIVEQDHNGDGAPDHRTLMDYRF